MWCPSQWLGGTDVECIRNRLLLLLSMRSRGDYCAIKTHLIRSHLCIWCRALVCEAITIELNASSERKRDAITFRAILQQWSRHKGSCDWRWLIAAATNLNTLCTRTHTHSHIPRHQARIFALITATLRNLRSMSSPLFHLNNLEVLRVYQHF